MRHLFLCRLPWSQSQNVTFLVITLFLDHLTIINRLRIQIMIHHAVLGHFFIFGARLSVVCVRVNGNAASWREFAPYFDVARVH
ncbi:hypothetical protein S100757_01552 [Bacillus subtilis subsp. subtilis]|nr:hypothetical protein BSBS38_01577 [Bacillus subtilis]ARV98407.1 hypothetical protein S101444_01559 [Bacillus subtilis subsp. subtilis]ARW02483.1 hypothetical protein S100757_01552 [Bacillus subtilis subsp. subtilis]ASB56889.1 hypothetical protein S100761_01560 [Bacillus subtilis subsp. subtilis]